MGGPGERSGKPLGEAGKTPMSPRPRFDSLASERQQVILQAAADEFAERGFEAASYNRIIQRSGVSKGAMYYYFDDKRDLYLTVLRDAERRATETIGPLADFDDAHSFWEALRDLYLRITGFVANEPLAAGLIKSAYGAGPAGDSAYSEFIERVSKQFEGVLSQGIRLGAVRPDMPLDLLLAVTLATGEATDRWALRNPDRLTELGPGAISEVAERLLEMHQRLIAPLSLLTKGEVSARRKQ
jgi:AcrR family transcriptional regulator